MQNISKIIKAFNLIGFFLLGVMTSTIVHATQNGVCLDNKNHGVYQNTLSQTAGCISFHFDHKSNAVLLTSSKPQSNKYTVIKISPERSPALNNEVEHMGFFTQKPVLIGNTEYIPLIYSMRTHSGSFGGECGAGVEDYLAVISLTKNAHFQKVFSRLISSCAQSLTYDENATRQQNGAVYVQGEYIYIDWYIYPDFEKAPIGKIHLLDGQIEYIDGIKNKDLSN
jgi:hypothetical protein